MKVNMNGSVFLFRLSIHQCASPGAPILVIPAVNMKPPFVVDLNNSLSPSLFRVGVFLLLPGFAAAPSTREQVGRKQMSGLVNPWKREDSKAGAENLGGE
jgi:hypothetical protein